MNAVLHDAAALMAVLSQWARAGWLRELDLAFAEFLRREAGDAPPLLLLGAALASHQLGRGHACLDLQATLQDPADVLALPPEEPDDAPAATVPPVTPAALLAGVGVPDWAAALRHPILVAPGEGATPLVHVGGRLYLRRYWQHERVVRTAILGRVSGRDDAPPAARLKPALDALFGKGGRGADGVDWQKVACAVAVRQPFAIITGGPGTGKTTTVVKVLALLQHLALEQGGAPLRVRLAAPTGKAAARLNASIAAAVEQLPLKKLHQPEVLRAAIPKEVTTVHRLLGSRPDTRRFRHHAGQPLPVDVLVLDEASMVDLEMMSAVLQALPAKARLVLLGDKDQLASVEAGAVLGELCRHADEGRYTAYTRAWVAAATGEQVPRELGAAEGDPLDQAVVKLRHSHRFGAGSGIGQLAEAVNAGAWHALAQLRAHCPPDLAFVEAGRDDAALRTLVLDGGRSVAAPGDGPLGYRHYLQVVRERRPPADAGQEAFDAWAAQVLAAFGQFQLLCALRRGPHGVATLNRRIAGLLLQVGLVDAASGWYAGRPVMVTRNDYGLGLMNGDVGITLALPIGSPGEAETVWHPRVAFPAGDGRGGIRWVLPSRLQAVETVFAMTVHKSQGSEFTHAALVLPERASRVLTRELVYTGVTRAKRWFTLAGPLAAGVLEQAVARRVRRAGGLLDA
jgi:exodeoxyribonuclease V alpha subunit